MTGEVLAPSAEESEIVVIPAKAVRLADMIENLVQELHAAPLDDNARSRFLVMYHSTLIEVGSTLSDALLDELDRIQTNRLDADATFDEVRIAMTQLEGWLHGLLIGVLTGRTRFMLPEVAGQA